MSKQSIESTDAQIDREAAEWLVLKDLGLTPEQQAKFNRWLTADPRNSEWFSRHDATWTEFDALSTCRPKDGGEPDPDLLAPVRRAPRWFFPTLLAAAASVALVLSLWRPWTRVTTAGLATNGSSPRYESRALEDGSIVDLNRGASLDSHFTPGERRVTLMSGEAHFMVTKNPNRPFIVSAGNVEIRAVGTAFDVRIESASVNVLVTEGHVRVDKPAASKSTPEPEIPVLAAGDQAVVPLALDSVSTQVTKVSGAKMAQLLSWRSDILDFNSTPLAEVVARFNANNRVKLVLGDPELGSLPIVASFRSENVEGFVRLLEVTAGVRAERPSPDQIILKRKP